MSLWEFTKETLPWRPSRSSSGGSIAALKERSVQRPELGAIYLAPKLFFSHSGWPHSFKEPQDCERRGTILVYPHAREAVAAIAHRRMAVSVLGSYEGLPIDSIDMDEGKAMASLVGYLSGAGHTRLGFLSWAYPVSGGSAARRFNAFLGAVRSLGIEFHEDWAPNHGPGATPTSPSEIADAVASKVEQGA